MVRYTDKTLMPFGKHKGEKLANVPAGYLLYILDEYDLSEPLKKYIEENKEVLQAEAKRSNSYNSR